MNELHIHDGTGFEPNWSGVPWRRNGILAISSGTPNSTPDSPAHTLATSAIKKAILSAHQGISTILLLEAQEKLELSPGARAENRNIQMHKVMTIPAGRLAQWKGRATWTHDKLNGTFTAANQDKERPKYSEDSNRFPILMVVYAPTTDTSFTQVTNKELRELAYALATCSNPKPTTKDEKRIMWHKPLSNSEKTELAIPYFEHKKPLNRQPPIPAPTYPDAMQDDDDEQREKDENSTGFKADSRHTKARLIAGRAMDTSRSIDRMLATRAATLLEALGATFGSLHMHHRTQRHARQCPCCRAFTTVGATLPKTTETTQMLPTDQLKKLVNQLRQQIFKKIVTEDLNDWAPPTETPDWTTPAQKHTAAQTPSQEKTSTHDRSTRSRTPKPVIDPQTTARKTKRDHKATQDSTEQKPPLPKSLLTQLVNVIKAYPINVCLACALPHTSAIQNKATPESASELTQDKHLDAWLEVCRIAQGTQPKLNVTTPQKWKATAINPIESPRHRHLQGQKITLKPAHEHGQPRTGRVLLVMETSNQRPQAFIHLDKKPEPATQCAICKKETPQQLQ